MRSWGLSWPLAKLTRRGVGSKVRWWQRQLGLQAWTIQTTFQKEGDEDASCSAQPEYQFAILYFDLDKIEPALIDSYIVHELVHCLVWPLANTARALALDDPSKLEWVRTEEESLTTRLEMLLRDLAPD